MNSDTSILGVVGGVGEGDGLGLEGKLKKYAVCSINHIDVA